MSKIRNLIQVVFRRKKITVLVIVVLIVAGFFIRRTLLPSKNGFEEAKIERGTVVEELILSGEVKSDEHATLNFLSSGELDYVGVV